MPIEAVASSFEDRKKFLKMKALEGDGMMIAFSCLYPVRALANALMKNEHIYTSHNPHYWIQQKMAFLNGVFFCCHLILIKHLLRQ